MLPDWNTPVADAEAGDGAEVLVEVLLRHLAAKHRDDVLREELAPGARRAARSARSSRRRRRPRGRARRRRRRPPTRRRRTRLRRRRGGRRGCCMRPRSSTGRSPPRTIAGFAMTPAVQTMRSVSKISPVDSSMLPSTALVSCVSRWIVGAALGEVLEHPVARLERHLGHDAAHRLDEVEVRLVEGELRVVLEQRRSRSERSSAKTSMPAKPPPTTTKVSRRSRSGPGGRFDALSKFVSTRSRIATASSIVFRPIALSAMPGIGNVRETAPAVTTICVVLELLRLTELGRDRGGLRRVVDAR